MTGTPALYGPRGEVLAPSAAMKPRASLSGPGASAFAYDAANPISQETDGWYPRVNSPDYEINVHRDRMVGRQRDLARNDGWVNGGLIRILDATIGAHYRLAAQPDYRALSLINKAFDAKWAADFRHAAEAKWRTFAEDPHSRFVDATRQLTFTQSMRLALRHKLLDGDCLFIVDWLPERMGYGAAKYATAFRMIDPDRLSNPMQMIDTLYMRGGVEIDADSVAVAYHIRRAHQNDWYGAVESNVWDRFERETDWGRVTVVHDFDRDRADQHRGVGVFAPVVNQLKMLTRYSAAELKAAVINAIFSFSVTSPYDPEGMREALEAGDNTQWYWDARKKYRDGRPLSMEEARILQLFPGEKAEPLSSTHPSTNHEGFVDHKLAEIATNLGTSKEQLTNGWSKMNYSSARTAILAADKTIVRRRLDFGANTATPLYGAWLEEAMDRGELPLPRNAPEYVEARASYARCRWIGPGRGWVDPMKERQAAILGMDAALSTLEDECAEQGGDWEERIDQRALEVERFKARGLKLPNWAGLENETAKETIEKPEAE